MSSGAARVRALVRRVGGSRDLVVSTLAQVPAPAASTTSPPFPCSASSSGNSSSTRSSSDCASAVGSSTAASASNLAAASALAASTLAASTIAACSSATVAAASSAAFAAAACAAAASAATSAAATSTAAASCSSIRLWARSKRSASERPPGSDTHKLFSIQPQFQVRLALAVNAQPLLELRNGSQQLTELLSEVAKAGLQPGVARLGTHCPLDPLDPGQGLSLSLRVQAKSRLERRDDAATGWLLHFWPRRVLRSRS